MTEQSETSLRDELEEGLEAQSQEVTAEVTEAVEGEVPE